MRVGEIVAVAGLTTLLACTAASPEDLAADNASSGDPAASPATSLTPTTLTPTTLSPTTLTPTTLTPTTVDPFARPLWLGASTLPLRPDGNGEVLPTPSELAPRVLRTPNDLPLPTSNDFAFTIQPVPEDVLARSSWVPECPVTVEELSYITLTHHGFDGELHTGELLVNAAVASDVVGVFQQLFDARFPIEQMRVVRLEEVDDPPTGDWNDTTSFVCRPAVGSSSWSQHAYGLAIDINPFHNPYLKADLVIPELASYYTDRTLELDGMLYAESVAVQAFSDIGWAWGGNWRSLKDWMHFSVSGG